MELVCQQCWRGRVLLPAPGAAVARQRCWCLGMGLKHPLQWPDSHSCSISLQLGLWNRNVLASVLHTVRAKSSSCCWGRGHLLTPLKASAHPECAWVVWVPPASRSVMASEASLSAVPWPFGDELPSAACPGSWRVSPAWLTGRTGDRLCWFSFGAAAETDRDLPCQDVTLGWRCCSLLAPRIPSSC